MKKIVTLTILLMMLCGCTIDYNMEIKSNGYINDLLYVEQLVSGFEEVKPDDWSSIKREKISDINIRNEFFEESATYEIKLKETYKSIDAFKDNKYFKKYVGEYKYVESDECTSSIVFNDAFKNRIYGTDSIAPYVESINVTITFPVKITKSNATKVEGDKYTWELSDSNRIEELYVKYKNPNIAKENNENAFDILIIVAIILLVVFIYITISKNKKTNAL